ncbi:porin family protein [Aquimarina agarilytica]|uniref:porin family protein n=1 Tax=Aquimarina agarilytica TaxID=1087449 RepID=UPI000287B9DA|nr:porin family protein [Aquimarina agarilytica]
MNKKILLLLISLLLGSIAIQAQQSKYGFRLGLNYSDIDFDDNSSGIFGGDKDARIGFAAGFFATYFLSEKFSIQPEIQYSSQGEKTQVLNKESVNVAANNPRSFDRLNYGVLQVPILFNYHITNNLHISVGPQAGILIWEWERAGNYEIFQFSGIGGIGYYFTDNLGVDLRASYGLTDVIKTNSTSTFDATGVNHYLQLTLSYRL